MSTARRAIRLAACFALALALGASGAHAHGDTIRVSYAVLKPERLTVPAGTTVHFENANASGAPCTIVIGDGVARSPALGRAEGWHYTFENPGEHRFFVEEAPSRAGAVIVLTPP